MHEAPPATPASADANAPESLITSALHQSLHQDMEFLSETIGPRGSATEDEAKAAHYVVERLSSLGLMPQRQDFKGAASAYAPYALATFMGLLSLFLFWQQQFMLTVFAIVFTALALAALLSELLFKDNVLRWVLYKDDSQNVFAEIKARSEESKAKIIITTHLDSHRTPLIFSSPGWLRFFQRMLPLGVGSLAALLGLFLIGLVTGLETLRWVALVPGGFVLVIFALMLQADTTDFTKGATDNASGVAVGLELASRLAQSPLTQHDVTLVFTGCEETGCYGADAFLRANKAALGNAIHFVIDQVGGKGTDPCILRSEQFLRPAHSDPALLKLADDLISAHPELNAHSRSARGAYSELSIGALHGLRPLGLFGVARDGSTPHWHQPTDTLANVDDDATARATELAWLLLQAVDQSP
jgi:Peptidase family M28